MAHAPSKRQNRLPMDADINLLPVLNLMVGLVPPLLMMAAFVHLAAIDVTLPTIEREASKKTPWPERVPLLVTLEMFPGKLKVTCNGGMPIKQHDALVAARKQDESTCGTTEFTKVGETFPWTALNKTMIQLKKNYPLDDSIVIRPSEGVIYSEIVAAMDATRQCAPAVATANANDCTTSSLFPNATFAFAKETEGGS